MQRVCVFVCVCGVRVFVCVWCACVRVCVWCACVRVCVGTCICIVEYSSDLWH